MKLGRDVSRHNELDNWRNTHRYESVMATIWLFLTISETDPGLWDRLMVNGHLEIPGESFADKFRTMERFQAEVRPLAPAS